MAQQKYFVNVHYDVVVPVEVIADNESDALEYAENKAEEYNVLEYGEVTDIIGSCVTDIEDI